MFLKWTVSYQQCAHNLDSPDEHVDGECHNISIPPKFYFLQIVLPGHDGVPPTHNRSFFRLNYDPPVFEYVVVAEGHNQGERCVEGELDPSVCNYLWYGEINFLRGLEYLSTCTQ